MGQLDHRQQQLPLVSPIFKINIRIFQIAASQARTFSAVIWVLRIRELILLYLIIIILALLLSICVCLRMYPGDYGPTTEGEWKG